MPFVCSPVIGSVIGPNSGYKPKPVLCLILLIGLHFQSLPKNLSLVVGGGKP